MAELTTSQEVIAAVCDELKAVLLEKNRKYGDSVLTPTRIFSRGTVQESLATRLDDKLSRIANRQSDEDEDPVTDLAGYLVLELARRRLGIK